MKMFLSTRNVAVLIYMRQNDSNFENLVFWGKQNVIINRKYKDVDSIFWLNLSM